MRDVLEDVRKHFTVHIAKTAEILTIRKKNYFWKKKSNWIFNVFPSPHLYHLPYIHPNWEQPHDWPWWTKIILPTYIIYGWFMQKHETRNSVHSTCLCVCVLLHVCGWMWYVIIMLVMLKSHKIPLNFKRRLVFSILSAHTTPYRNGWDVDSVYKTTHSVCFFASHNKCSSASEFSFCSLYSCRLLWFCPAVQLWKLSAFECVDSAIESIRPIVQCDPCASILTNTHSHYHYLRFGLYFGVPVHI